MWIQINNNREKLNVLNKFQNNILNAYLKMYIYIMEMILTRFDPLFLADLVLYRGMMSEKKATCSNQTQFVPFLQMFCEIEI